MRASASHCSFPGALRWVGEVRGPCSRRCRFSAPSSPSPARRSPSSRRSRPSCASSGRRNFSRPPSCSPCSACSCTCSWGPEAMTPVQFVMQLLNALAAMLLLLSFAMLAQRRVVTLVDLFALQGAVLCAATLLLAWRTGETNLYISAALTLALKVIVLPRLLHRLIRKLGV